MDDARVKQLRDLKSLCDDGMLDDDAFQRVKTSILETGAGMEAWRVRQLREAAALHDQDILTDRDLEDTRAVILSAPDEDAASRPRGFSTPISVPASAKRPRVDAHRDTPGARADASVPVPKQEGGGRPTATPAPAAQAGQGTSPSAVSTTDLSAPGIRCLFSQSAPTAADLVFWHRELHRPRAGTSPHTVRWIRFRSGGKVITQNPLKQSHTGARARAGGCITWWQPSAGRFFHPVAAHLESKTWDGPVTIVKFGSVGSQGQPVPANDLNLPVKDPTCMVQASLPAREPIAFDRVELAKTGRSACKACNYPIPQGSVRFGFTTYYRNRANKNYVHAECALPRLQGGLDAAKQLGGWDALPAAGVAAVTEAHARAAGADAGGQSAAGDDDDDGGDGEDTSGVEILEELSLDEVLARRQAAAEQDGRVVDLLGADG